MAHWKKHLNQTTRGNLKKPSFLISCLIHDFFHDCVPARGPNTLQKVAEQLLRNGVAKVIHILPGGQEKEHVLGTHQAPDPVRSEAWGGVSHRKTTRCFLDSFLKIQVWSEKNNILGFNDKIHYKMLYISIFDVNIYMHILYISYRLSLYNSSLARKITSWYSGGSVTSDSSGRNEYIRGSTRSGRSTSQPLGKTQNIGTDVRHLPRCEECRCKKSVKWCTDVQKDDELCYVNPLGKAPLEFSHLAQWTVQRLAGWYPREAKKASFWRRSFQPNHLSDTSTIILYHSLQQWTDP